MDPNRRGGDGIFYDQYTGKNKISKSKLANLPYTGVDGLTDLSYKPGTFTSYKLQHGKTSSAKKRPASTQLTNMPKKRMTLTARLASVKSPVPSMQPSTLVPGATELSGLLQKMKGTDELTVGTGSSVLSGTSSLSQILSAAAQKASEVGSSQGSTVGNSTLLASAVKSQTVSEESRSSSGFKSLKLKPGTSGQHQILVRTGNNSSPISIPLSMAQKLVTGSSLVHITTASTGTSQIHQLLSKMNKSPVTSNPEPSSSALPSVIFSASSVSSSVSGRESLPSTSSVSTSTLDENTSDSVSGRTVASTQGADSQQVQAIQKLQFHDFPLTTTSFNQGTSSSGGAVTQAKILSTKIDIGKLSMADITRLAVPSNRSLINKSPVTVTIPKITSSPRVTSPVTMAKGSNQGSTAIKSVIMTIKPDASSASSESKVLEMPVVRELVKIPPAVPPESSKPVLQEPVLASSEPAEESGELGTSTPTSSVGSSDGLTSDQAVAEPTSSPATPTVASTRTRRIKTPKQYDA